jgi:hypothetical protein
MLPHVLRAQKRKRSRGDERSRRCLGRETMHRSARLHASPRYTVLMPILISVKDCLRVSGVLLCPTFSKSRQLLAEEDPFRRGDTVATIAGLDSARAPHVSGDSDGCVLSRIVQHAFASVSQLSLPLLPVDAFLCIRALSSGHVCSNLVLYSPAYSSSQLTNLPLISAEHICIYAASSVTVLPASRALPSSQPAVSDAPRWCHASVSASLPLLHVCSNMVWHSPQSPSHLSLQSPSHLSLQSPSHLNSFRRIIR